MNTRTVYETQSEIYGMNLRAESSEDCFHCKAVITAANIGGTSQLHNEGIERQHRVEQS